MPRGSRKRKFKSDGKRALLLIPLSILFLSLAWVWKANRVKEYYSQMKGLEDSKNALLAENAQLYAKLADLKSLMVVDKKVSKSYNLTQNVKDRIFLPDPVESPNSSKISNFVNSNLDNITDWLEGVVVRSGRVTAKERQKDSK